MNQSQSTSSNLHCFTSPALLVVATTTLASCGFQLGGGATPIASGGWQTRYVTTAVQTQNARGSGSLVGLRMASFPDSDGLHVKNAVLAFGYDVHTGKSLPLGVEGAFE